MDLSNLERLQNLLDIIQTDQPRISSVTQGKIKFAVRTGNLQILLVKKELSNGLFEFPDEGFADEAFDFDNDSPPLTFSGKRSLCGKIGL